MKKLVSIIVISCCMMMFVSIKPEAQSFQVIHKPSECHQQAKGPWSGYVKGGDNIADNGCGLVSTTNAVEYLTGNFIDPVDICDYAYAIDAYNGSIGAGTARWVLYYQLQDFEKKYGFKVINTGMSGTVDNPSVNKSLKRGCVLIAYVYGHFIAIVDYNEETNEYLVYDCAANPTKRFSYPYGTWLSHDILTTSQYMSVAWYCILEKTQDGIVSLDQEGNIYQNSTGSLEYFVTQNENINIPVSGFALDTRGVESFYYTVDSSKTEYPLASMPRYEIYDYFEDFQETSDPLKTGFKGIVSTSDLSVGSHRVYIKAKTSDGGVRDVAKLFVNKSNKLNAINEETKVLTYDMSAYYGQTDVISSWPQASVNEYMFRANYGSVVDLGIIDFSKFKKAVIYYSTDKSFISNKNGVQSVIGFKNANYDYGYYGKPLNLKNDIAHANMTNGSVGWHVSRQAVVNLEGINYHGRTFLNGYNQQSALYIVTKIEFYYNDDYEFHEYKEATCDEPKTCIHCEDTIGHPLGHYYLPATCQSAAKCYRCGETTGEIGDHTWVDATCLSPKKCSVCGLTEGNSLGHDYEPKTRETTCALPGMIYDECKRCKDIVVNSYIDQLPHDLIHHDRLEPTCVNSGHEAYDECKNCDYTTFVSIEELGHKYEYYETIEAKCEQRGYIVNKCTLCDSTIKTVIQPLSHEYEFVEKVNPTCTTQGYDLSKCIHCESLMKNNYVQAKGHKFTFVPALHPTCTADGYSDHNECSECHHTDSKEIIPAVGHNYSEIVIPATKKSQGMTQHTCTKCYDYYEDNYVDKIKGCKTSTSIILSFISLASSCLYIIFKKKS